MKNAPWLELSYTSNPLRVIQNGVENLSYPILQSIDESLKELVRIERDRHMREIIREINSYERRDKK